MDLTPELLGTGVVGLIVILGAVGSYIRGLRGGPKMDPAMMAIGAELGSRQQMDELIVQVRRIADALTDKNTAGINERLDELAERLEDRLPERTQPPRRR